MLGLPSLWPLSYTLEAVNCKIIACAMVGDLALAEV